MSQGGIRFKRTNPRKLRSIMRGTTRIVAVRPNRAIELPAGTKVLYQERRIDAFFVPGRKRVHIRNSQSNPILLLAIVVGKHALACILPNREDPIIFRPQE